MKSLDSDVVFTHLPILATELVFEFINSVLELPDQGILILVVIVDLLVVSSDGHELLLGVATTLDSFLKVEELPLQVSIDGFQVLDVLVLLVDGFNRFFFLLVNEGLQFSDPALQVIVFSLVASQQTIQSLKFLDEVIDFGIGFRVSSVDNAGDVLVVLSLHVGDLGFVDVPDVCFDIGDVSTELFIFLS